MALLVTLSLAAAALCFNARCVPALVGAATPTGAYQLALQPTAQPGYDGDVLLFKATDTAWYAVHRTWPGREQMYGLPSTQRRYITLGCINVEPVVYAELRRLAATGTDVVLIIAP